MDFKFESFEVIKYFMFLINLGISVKVWFLHELNFEENVGFSNKS